jgi:hypothetical protein
VAEEAAATPPWHASIRFKKAHSGAVAHLQEARKPRRRLARINAKPVMMVRAVRTVIEVKMVRSRRRRRRVMMMMME